MGKKNKKQTKPFTGLCAVVQMIAQLHFHMEKDRKGGKKWTLCSYLQDDPVLLLCGRRGGKSAAELPACFYSLCFILAPSFSSIT